jgi:hypothetical protein
MLDFCPNIKWETITKSLKNSKIQSAEVSEQVILLSFFFFLHFLLIKIDPLDLMFLQATLVTSEAEI